MKAKRIILATVILAFVASPLLAKNNQNQKNSPVPALSEKEASDLIFLREEEKLARDVYLAMYDVWEVQIFLNISSSEQRHMSAVANLLDKYGLEDPVVDDTPGVFTNEVLAEIYTTLIDKGELSLLDALEVGVAIEEMDIHDIEVEMLPDSTKSDVKRVLTNLLGGSYNHLDAFEGALVALP